MQVAQPAPAAAGNNAVESGGTPVEGQTDSSAPPLERFRCRVIPPPEPGDPNEGVGWQLYSECLVGDEWVKDGLERRFRRTGEKRFEGTWNKGVPVGRHISYLGQYGSENASRVRDVFEYDGNGELMYYQRNYECLEKELVASTWHRLPGSKAGEHIGISVSFHSTGEVESAGLARFWPTHAIGERFTYHRNGKLQSKGQYDFEGRKQGVWREWDDKGTLLSEVEYLDDVERGP